MGCHKFCNSYYINSLKVPIKLAILHHLGTLWLFQLFFIIIYATSTFKSMMLLQ